MRLAAILINILCISILSIAVISCDTEQRYHIDADKELNKLQGPDTGTIDKTLLNQAQQAINNGDYNRAAQMYAQLSDTHPDKKQYTISLADCLRRAGNNDAALKAINPLIKKDPENADALEIKGLALMNLGGDGFTEASKTFEKVMKIDGHRWRTLNAIGILFAIKHMDHDAIQYYNAALKSSPDNPGILNNLGLAYAMDKQYDESIATFTRARSRLESNSEELKQVDLNLALVYALEDRLDDAEQVAAPHLSKAALYNNMGVYAYISKNKELAKSYMDMALDQNPMYYERAWKNLSVISGDNSSELNTDEATQGDLTRHEHIFNDEEPPPEQHAEEKHETVKEERHRETKSETLVPPAKETPAETKQAGKPVQLLAAPVPTVNTTNAPALDNNIKSAKTDNSGSDDNRPLLPPSAFAAPVTAPVPSPGAGPNAIFMAPPPPLSTAVPQAQPNSNP